MKSHICLFLLLEIGVFITAHANPETQMSQQSIAPITGTVVDENGDPVIGASVFEKDNSRNGTATDIDGQFSLNVKPETKLKVSYIGYHPTEVSAVNGMIITLSPSDALLDEVVIVGYGTQKKVNLTGAVSTVDIAKTLEGRPQHDLAKALQGAVPGLTITNSSGDINGTPKMEIRGVGSIQATVKPFYVVDGVPMDDISFLNPEDVENISVLKDAASSSIYGTRAAGGVILIKTKTAKNEDRVTIKYSNNFSWSQATYLPEYSSVANQIISLGQANKRAGAVNELFGMDLDAMLPYAEAWAEQNNGKAGYREMRPFQSWDDVGDYYVDENGNNALYYADWDVAGIMFNDAAPAQSHNFSIQGSTGRANYYLAFGYNSKEDISNFNPAKLKRYNVNANFNVALTDWLTMGSRIQFINKEYDSPNCYRNPYTYLWRWGSFFGPYGYVVNEDGEKLDCTNAILYRKQAGNDHDVTTFTRLNGYMTAQIIKGLTLQADFTYDISNRNNEYDRMPITMWNTWSTSPSQTTLLSQSNTYQTQTNTKIDRWTTNIYATYEHTFVKDHNMKVMAGFTADQEDNRYFYARRMNLLDNNLPELNLATGTQTVSSSAGHWATAGFFGRVNYDYKGIYLFEANARYDASSKFPLNKQWGFFPSMSAGYRFSEEAYFEPIKDIVNNGKLRFSFGEIGNDNIGDNMFISTIGDDITSRWVNGSVMMPMYEMPSLVSSDLSWERMRTLDIGLDLGFLNNSLTVGFDWYQRDTKNMIAPASELPGTVGDSAPWINAGSLRTRGWEFSVNWNHRFGEVDVYVSANISDYKTKITEWDNPNKAIDNYYAGSTYGDIWGFETDRYFEESDFVGKNDDGSWIYAPGVADQTGLQSGNFVYGPGDIKFVDRNGDGVINGGDPNMKDENGNVIPAGTANNHGDLKVIGNTQPRYQYGFHIGGGWKGFDIDLYFQGVGKRDMWTQSAFVMPMMRGADGVYSHMESYNKLIFDGDNQVIGYEIDQSNKYPVMYAGGEGSGMVDNISKGRYNFYPQTRYLVDMSYLRLKNITIGYTLPQMLTRKAYIEKARVYFSVDNIALLYRGNSDYPLDPELNSGSTNSWGRATPIAKTFSCGLQVTF